VPHLAAVIVGNDGASLTYGSKVKACERVGFESTLVKMQALHLKRIKKIKN
jgi:methylenetetrahydrofolate dehydrogenase (NADP+)/methenyltetrahydrofolate cyclohydrolase